MPLEWQLQRSTGRPVADGAERAGSPSDDGLSCSEARKSSPVVEPPSLASGRDAPTARRAIAREPQRNVDPPAPSPPRTPRPTVEAPPGLRAAVTAVRAPNPAAALSGET